MGSTRKSNEPRGGLFQVAKRTLNGDVAGYLRDRRAEGMSWRQMSRELYSESGVPVSEETLANWAERLGVEQKAS